MENAQVAISFRVKFRLVYDYISPFLADMLMHNVGYLKTTIFKKIEIGMVVCYTGLTQEARVLI